MTQAPPPSWTQAPVACDIPLVGPDGWGVAAPEAVGLASASLYALGEHFRTWPEANVHSVLVVRRGVLVYEQYFAGDDEDWGRPMGRVTFDRDTKHDLRSITKSVTSLLVGIAIHRKLLESVDEPIFTFFPEHADLRTPEKDRILLRHLLMMAAGLEWEEWRPSTDPMNSEIRMMYSPDRCRFTLGQPVVEPPGRVWNYSSGASDLLGAVVRKTAARPLEDFAREFLFQPLAITDTAWNTYPESDITSGAGGLRLRPRDMAKLGQLVLDRGRWNGQQIVPADWIDESITPQIGCSDNIYFYGYQWGLGRSLVNKREILWVAASGLGGQRIFVVPALDLVVVITGGLYTSPREARLPVHILNRYVLLAV
jgi:CubicO group peptidase (beta-lactamase class C family)